MTAADLDAFDRLRMATIVDLRRVGERERWPGPRRSLHLPLRSTVLTDTDPANLADEAAAHRWLRNDYLWMLTESAPDIGLVFNHVAQPEARPTVFHCMSGKDRTGLISALLLLVLGVDIDTVLDDYEHTNANLDLDHIGTVVAEFERIGIPVVAGHALLRCARPAMADALEFATARPGGIEAFLQRRAGVTKETIRALQSALLTTGIPGT